jgi:hypothetical protein
VEVDAGGFVRLEEKLEQWDEFVGGIDAVSKSRRSV